MHLPEVGRFPQRVGRLGTLKACRGQYGQSADAKECGVPSLTKKANQYKNHLSGRVPGAYLLDTHTCKTLKNPKIQSQIVSQHHTSSSSGIQICIKSSSILPKSLERLRPEPGLSMLMEQCTVMRTLSSKSALTLARGFLLEASNYFGLSQASSTICI